MLVGILTKIFAGFCVVMAAYAGFTYQNPVERLHGAVGWILAALFIYLASMG